MFTDEHWPTATRTQTWATLADLWQAARRRLPDDVWDFLVGGSGDETTLRENCSAFSGWRLRPRVMGGHAPPGGIYPMGGPAAYEDVFGQLFRRDDRVWSWDELAAVCAQTRLPWMAKGILTAGDARAAVAAGASAVIVSTHGGRQLDRAPAALTQLPEVVAAVEGRALVALDSGIRRGADVVTALALGADVVVVGRLAAVALAAGGQAGVERMHALLREEMRTILMLLGVPSVRALDRTLLQAA